MKVVVTSLPGVLVIEPVVHVDARGTFVETWARERYAAAGIDGEFVQDNASSSARGVLRGLHYQRARPQGKLVYVTRGEIFDVAVDLRIGAPTFGRWTGVALSAGAGRQVWLPPGFAHGYLVTGGDGADVTYKATTPYAPDDAHALRWDDPDVAIAWPLAAGAAPILSATDAAAPSLAELRAAGRLPRMPP